MKYLRKSNSSVDTIHGVPTITIGMTSPSLNDLLWPLQSFANSVSSDPSLLAKIYSATELSEINRNRAVYELYGPAIYDYAQQTTLSL